MAGFPWKVLDYIFISLDFVISDFSFLYLKIGSLISYIYSFVIEAKEPNLDKPMRTEVGAINLWRVIPYLPKIYTTHLMLITDSMKACM